MTERRMQNDLGFTQPAGTTFLEPSPEELRAARERTASNLRLFWEHRRFLLRWTLIGSTTKKVARASLSGGRPWT
jgi:nucleotide-binding universal stress UspA family protein